MESNSYSFTLTVKVKTFKIGANAQVAKGSSKLVKASDCLETWRKAIEQMPMDPERRRIELLTILRMESDISELQNRCQQWMKANSKSFLPKAFSSASKAFGEEVYDSATAHLKGAERRSKRALDRLEKYKESRAAENSAPSAGTDSSATSSPALRRVSGSLASLAVSLQSAHISIDTTDTEVQYTGEPVAYVPSPGATEGVETFFGTSGEGENSEPTSSSTSPQSISDDPPAMTPDITSPQPEHYASGPPPYIDAADERPTSPTSTTSGSPGAGFSSAASHFAAQRDLNFTMINQHYSLDCSVQNPIFNLHFGNVTNNIFERN